MNENSAHCSAISASDLVCFFYLVLYVLSGIELSAMARSPLVNHKESTSALELESCSLVDYAGLKPSQHEDIDDGSRKSSAPLWWRRIGSSLASSRKSNSDDGLSLFEAIFNQACGLRTIQDVKELLEDGHDANQVWHSAKLYNRLKSSRKRLGNEGSEGRFNENKLGLLTADWALCVTPLLLSIAYASPAVTQLLLQYGASTEIRARNGPTPLQAAVNSDDLETARMLVNHGGTVQAGAGNCEYAGFTALHLAVMRSDFEMTNFLLSVGADITATSTFGWTPLDIAILNWQPLMAKHLLDRITSTAQILPTRHDTNSACIGSMPEQEIKAFALDLLLHGIFDSDEYHRAVYEKCLLKVLSTDISGSNHEAISAEVLLEKVEITLTEFADDGKISWQRNLCLQCSNFQGQDFKLLSQPFDHSEDFAALERSAQDGCTLCQILAEVLVSAAAKAGRSLDRGNGHIFSTKGQEIAIALDPILDKSCNGKGAHWKLVITCNGIKTDVSLEWFSGM